MASEYMFGVRSDYGRLPGWDRAKRCDVAELLMGWKEGDWYSMSRPFTVKEVSDE